MQTKISDFKPYLILPLNLSRFEISQNERTHLCNAIEKIKYHQLLALIRDIKPLLEFFEDDNKQKMKDLLDLATLNLPLTPEERNNIFSIDLSKDYELENIPKDQVFSEKTKLTKNQFLVRMKGNVMEYQVTDPFDKTIIGEFDENTLEEIFSTKTFELINPINISKVKPYFSKMQEITFKRGHTYREEIDQQLKTALEKIDASDLYDTIRTFRQMYVLNKATKIRNNDKAFPESISDRLIRAWYNKEASAYLLTNEANLTSEEFSILQKIYPINLLKNKIFKRDAHCDIALTPYEIQTLISGMAKSMFATDKISGVNIQPLQLSNQQTHHLNEYTLGQFEALIAERDVQKIINHLNKNKSLINSVAPFDGMTALLWATKYQLEELVSYLLANGADVNAKNKNDYSVLHYAVEGNNEKIFKMIVNVANLNVNVEDRGKYTPLYLAAELGKENYLTALLAREADPNIANNRYKSTALHIAVRNQHKIVVEKLLACEKVNKELKNSTGKTAKESAKNKEIQQLFDSTTQKSVTASASVTNSTAVTAKIISNQNAPATSSPTSTQKSQAPTQNLQVNNLVQESLKKMLLRPKDNRQMLIATLPKCLLVHNPFPIVSGNNIATSVSYKNFYENLNNELIDAERIREKFSYCVGKMQELKNQKLTFPQIYNEILNLSEDAIRNGVSRLALIFEIYRAGYLEVIINLEEKKSPMQVAIDSEDLDAINYFLEKEPSRADDNNIIYQQITYTEFEYAIYKGKVNVVRKMLEMGEKNSKIILGKIPDDAIAQAESRNEEVTKLNPAIREAAEYYDIDIPKVLKINAIKLMRRLQEPVRNEQTINGFYKIKEYPVVQVLIAEKESASKDSLGSKLWRKLRGITHLKIRKKVVENSGNQQLQSEFKDINVALDYLIKTDVVGRHKKYQEQFAIPKDLPKAKTILQHATSNYPAIEKAGQLVTPQEILKNGKLRFVSTPEGTRNNIFFSLFKTAITTLRSNANHILELDLVIAQLDNAKPKLVNGKLVNAERTDLLAIADMYLSPHIPAFRIERAETPIIFIGEDPTIKTIYRVFHLGKDGEYKKIHRYDYYKNDQYISSDYEENTMSDEFFAGDIKLMAMLFIYRLRKLKGPFEKGSYYDYILNNVHKLEVLDAARGALFNVFNVEAKISKNITIAHPAVTAFENERTKRYKPLSDQVMVNISELIQNGNLEELSIITQNGCFKEQLGFALLAAVSCQKFNIVKYLLDLGVNVNFENNKIFHVAMLELERYSGEKNFNNEDFKIAYDILALLLSYGAADENDPSHIRHGASVDNFSSLRPTNVWFNNSVNDQLDLKKLFFKFENPDVIKLILNHCAKYLSVLYSFTHVYRLDEWHKLIAEKLNLKTKEMDNEVAKLLDLIDKNEVEKISRFFSSEKTSVNPYFYLFVKAIQTGKTEIVKICYPYYKSTANEKFFSSLHLAIKFNQLSVIPVLLEIGASLTAKNFLGESPAEYAVRVDNAEAVAMLGSGQNNEELIATSIKNKKQRIVQKLVEKLDLNNLTNEKFKFNFIEFEKRCSALNTAVICDNGEATKMLLAKYKSLKTTHVKLYKEIIEHFFGVSIIKGAINSYSMFLNEIMTDVKLFKAVFGKGKKLTLIIERGSKELLEKFLNGEFTPGMLKSLMDNDENYIGSAIVYNKLDQLTLLRKKFDLPYVNSEPNSNIFKSHFKVLECIIKYSTGVDMLKYVMNDGVLMPQEFELKARLLNEAIKNGNLEIIKWLFENKYCHKGETSTSDNMNYLQYIFMLEDDLKNDKKENFAKTLQYLLDEIKIDVNHKDNKNESLLLYPINRHCILQGMMMSFALECKDAILVIKGNNNDTVLHRQWRSLNPTIVDNYIAQGGDINAVNDEGLTIREKAIKSGCHIDVAKKLIALDAKARTYLQTMPTKFYIATFVKDNKLQIWVNHNKSLLFSDKPDLESSLFRFEKKNNNPQEIELYHNHSDYVSNPLRLEASHEDFPIFSKTLNAVPDENKFLSNHGSLQIVLEMIYIKYKSSVDQGLKFNTDDYVLTKEIHDEVYGSLKRSITFSKQIYDSIISGDIETFKQKYKEFHVNRHQYEPIPFCAITLNNEATKYEWTQFNSFVHAVIKNQQVEMLKFMIEHGGLKCTAKDFKETSPIKYAIQAGSVECFNLLMDNSKDLTAQYLFDIFHSCRTELMCVSVSTANARCNMIVAFIDQIILLDIGRFKKIKQNIQGTLEPLINLPEFSSEKDRLEDTLKKLFPSKYKQQQKKENTGKKKAQKTVKKGKRSVDENESDQSKSEDKSSNSSDELALENKKKPKPNGPNTSSYETRSAFFQRKRTLNQCNNNNNNDEREKQVLKTG